MTRKEKVLVFIRIVVEGCEKGEKEQRLGNRSLAAANPVAGVGSLGER
jgi:hypothetical protein